MNFGEIANTVCMFKSLVGLEDFNTWMKSPNKIKLGWTFIQSKQAKVVDENIVRKYYDIIK